MVKLPTIEAKPVQQKDLYEETEFNVTEYDPMSTFWEVEEKIRDNTESESLGQHSTKISFVGIRKNSVPVFKTKWMSKSVFDYSKPEIVYTQSDYHKESVISNVDTKPNLNGLVSKIGKKPSVQVWRKDYIDNKECKLLKNNSSSQSITFCKYNHIYFLNLAYERPGKRLENDAHNFSSDESYIISQKSKLMEVSFDSDENEIHKVHMLQSLQALQYLNTVQIPPMKILKDKLVFLPNNKGKKKSKNKH